jgi:general secretion pathway protein G
MKKSAFTMIELVFVIVVLGILAAIAVPKLAATRTDAEITSGRATISSVRSGIVSERQTRLLRGDSLYIRAADMDTTAGLFGGVLTYPVTALAGRNGHWSGSATTGYVYQVGGTSCNFAYDENTGTFSLTSNSTICKLLVD